MSPYAAETEVPVERSKSQIEAMLRQRGATDYATGWDAHSDRIQFRLNNVTVRFTLPRPLVESFATDKNGRDRREAVAVKMLEQAQRARWRALYLVIKAKLEAVDTGIAIYEEEFMAFVVMSDGKTIGEILVPQIQQGSAKLRLGDGK